MATESGMPTGKLVVERFIHTSREKLFEAWINPKSVALWMRPKGVTAVEADLDPRVGGQLRVLTKGADGDCECTGKYHAIESPSNLAFSWTSRDTEGQPTLITVELSEDEMEPGTALKITHSGFVSPEAVRKHGAAWETMLDKLGLLEKTKRKRRRKMTKAGRPK